MYLQLILVNFLDLLFFLDKIFFQFHFLTNLALKIEYIIPEFDLEMPLLKQLQFQDHNELVKQS